MILNTIHHEIQRICAESEGNSNEKEICHKKTLGQQEKIDEKITLKFVMPLNFEEDHCGENVFSNKKNLLSEKWQRRLALAIEEEFEHAIKEYYDLCELTSNEFAPKNKNSSQLKMRKEATQRIFFLQNLKKKINENSKGYVPLSFLITSPKIKKIFEELFPTLCLFSEDYMSLGKNNKQYEDLSQSVEKNEQKQNNLRIQCTLLRQCVCDFSKKLWANCNAVRLIDFYHEGNYLSQNRTNKDFLLVSFLDENVYEPNEILNILTKDQTNLDQQSLRLERNIPLLEKEYDIFWRVSYEVYINKNIENKDRIRESMIKQLDRLKICEIFNNIKITFPQKFTETLHEEKLGVKINPYGKLSERENHLSNILEYDNSLF